VSLYLRAAQALRELQGPSDAYEDLIEELHAAEEAGWVRFDAENGTTYPPEYISVTGDFGLGGCGCAWVDSSDNWYLRETGRKAYPPLRWRHL